MYACDLVEETVCDDSIARKCLCVYVAFIDMSFQEQGGLGTWRQRKVRARNTAASEPSKSISDIFFLLLGSVWGSSSASVSRSANNFVTRRLSPITMSHTAGYMIGKKRKMNLKSPPKFLKFVAATQKQKANGQELSCDQQHSLDKTAATKTSTCGIPSSQSGLRNCVRMSASMPFHLGILGESEHILKRRSAF